MNKYFAYIRVSTVKQGQHGVSLQEQRDAIEQYANRENLNICEWFEEQETAAKRGRAKFKAMLRRLQKGSADGVLIHKVDRGTRNHRDWADITDLLDVGTDFRFVTDNLDLSTRGGRLAADIQVAVAADYIRNLREETKKGLRGRLKQGLYPWAAPLGYLDCGGGKPKVICPQRGPLVAMAFELYATGEYSLNRLQRELKKRGLTSNSGKPLTVSMVSRLLHRIFYTGILRVGTNEETFQGIHEPLVSPVLFRAVQTILKGKTNIKIRTHSFAYRALIKCTNCNRTLIAEKQKDHAYYRCHNRSCKNSSVAEYILDAQISDALDKIRLSDTEAKELLIQLGKIKLGDLNNFDNEKKALDMQIGQLKKRLDSLTDKYVDDDISKEIYSERRERLLLDLAQADQDKASLESENNGNSNSFEKMFELVKIAQHCHFMGNPAEKRELLKIVFSNFSVDRKKLSVEPYPAFKRLSNRFAVPAGCPRQCINRKLAWEFARAANRHFTTPNIE